MQKKLHIDTSSVSNLRFADDIDLLGGSEDELQQLTERLDETAAGYGMEISAPTKAKFSSTASGQCQHIDEWKNAGGNGPVQILRIHTNKQ